MTSPEENNQLSDISRKELLNKAKLIGEHNLDPAQAALFMNMDQRAYATLAYSDPEFTSIVHNSRLNWTIQSLNIIKNIATDPNPENKQRLPAAKYIYELFSGNDRKGNTFVAIQNIAPQYAKNENNIKLLEALDAETIQAIEND